MAQHVEIGKAGFDLFFASVNPEQFRDYPEFKRVPIKIDDKKYGHIYLNSRDYHYNRGGGLKGDEYVLTYEPKDEICSYEIHFNYRNKINKVYLVM